MWGLADCQRLSPCHGTGSGTTHRDPCTSAHPVADVPTSYGCCQGMGIGGEIQLTHMVRKRSVTQAPGGEVCVVIQAGWGTAMRVHRTLAPPQ